MSARYTAPVGSPSAIGAIAASQLGQPNGPAQLGPDGKLSADQIDVSIFNAFIPTSGQPSNTLGEDEDYAFDPVTLLVWGPKASGAWPAAPVTQLASAPGWDMPTGVISESVPSFVPQSAQSPLVSGRLQLVRVYLPAGKTVNHLSWIAGSTGVTGPLNQWSALFDISRNKLGVSNDHTTEAWANTEKTFDLATGYTPAVSGFYYAGLDVTSSGASPTLLGIAQNNNLLAQAPIRSGYADTGRTDPTTCPATAAALTTNSVVPYVAVS